MQFAVLILTKSPVSSALPCQQKKEPCHNPGKGFDRVVWCFLFIACHLRWCQRFTAFFPPAMYMPLGSPSSASFMLVPFAHRRTSRPSSV